MRGAVPARDAAPSPSVSRSWRLHTDLYGRIANVDETPIPEARRIAAAALAELAAQADPRLAADSTDAQFDAEEQLEQPRQGSKFAIVREAFEAFLAQRGLVQLPGAASSSSSPGAAGTKLGSRSGSRLLRASGRVAASLRAAPPRSAVVYGDGGEAAAVRAQRANDDDDDAACVRMPSADVAADGATTDGLSAVGLTGAPDAALAFSEADWEESEDDWEDPEEAAAAAAEAASESPLQQACLMWLQHMGAAEAAALTEGASSGSVASSAIAVGNRAAIGRSSFRARLPAVHAAAAWECACNSWW